MEGLHFGEHWSIKFLGLSFNLDTIIMAWVVMLFILISSIVLKGGLSMIPSKRQAFLESIIDFLEGIAKSQLGSNYYRHMTLICSLFLFIFLANLAGQLPFKLIHIPNGELASPTNDINTTVALALTVSLYYFYSGISERGLNFFKHYFSPVWFMFPMNILEDITRPLSLSIRLFANILAGEVIVMVLISLVPLFLPVPIMLFELFVAFIQAFIFTILSASYISFATAEEH